MSSKVLKFGGTSLADAKHFKQVAEIIKSDPERRYIVASAPGKRMAGDTKVTDLLYQCYELAVNDEDINEVFNQIKERNLSKQMFEATFQRRRSRKCCRRKTLHPG